MSRCGIGCGWKRARDPTKTAHCGITLSSRCWVNLQSEDAGDIVIQIRDATVTLEGRVGSLTHRRLAEVLAWWSAGCEDVDNRLRVVPPEQENDGELSDAVRIVIEKDPLVQAGQLAVSVRGKIVTLSGYAASKEEQRLAVLDTWYVPGVRDVIDRIQIT